MVVCPIYISEYKVVGHHDPFKIKIICSLLRSCLVDPRRMSFFMVEQVLPPMGRISQCIMWIHDARWRGERKWNCREGGNNNIFTFKIFLFCHKIWILFHKGICIVWKIHFTIITITTMILIKFLVLESLIGNGRSLRKSFELWRWRVCAQSHYVHHRVHQISFLYDIQIIFLLISSCHSLKFGFYCLSSVHLRTNPTVKWGHLTRHPFKYPNYLQLTIT